MYIFHKRDTLNLWPYFFKTLRVYIGEGFSFAVANVFSIQDPLHKETICQKFAMFFFFFSFFHRKHTLLLNRKRVNKGMIRTNSLPLSPVILTRPYCRENRHLKVLRSTGAPNSYLGFSALGKKIFFCFMYKIWQGRQLFHQTFIIWMQSEYSLESLNFAAFTKPNKHKTDSKDFSTTWSSLFSNTFTTDGEFKRLLQSFFENRFSRHDGTVLPVPVTSTSARSSSPSSPTRAFWHDKSLHTPSPGSRTKLPNLCTKMKGREYIPEAF